MTTIRIWFTKTNEASYISLLDLQRVMQRAVKRSGLPVWHTLGFNPHIYMTFACPLPLGQESLVESVDVKTEAENPDLAAWKDSLSQVMPRGVEIVQVEPPQYKADAIGFAKYTVTLPEKFAESIDGYNQLDSAVIMKKSKRGQKPVELKEFQKEIAYKKEDGRVVFEMQLPAGGDGLNLNPSLWLGFLNEHFGVDETQASVLRTALLTKDLKEFR